MTLFSWLWRGAAVLVGLALIVHVVDFGMLTFMDGRPATPLQFSSIAWDIWFVSWIVASVWSRPAAAQPSLLDQVLHWTPTIIGFGLLAYGSAAPTGNRIADTPIWHLPENARWVILGLCAAGLLFTWWARIALGALWSGSVSRKDDHTVVRTGPYRLVRHPIYTGLIIAALAHAVQVSMLANLAGAVLMSFGFWMKARLEERFLSEELGADAYADYRRRTPMLIPFWPT